MKAKEFLKQELQSLVENHQQLKVRYEHIDGMPGEAGTHFVEITPSEIYTIEDDRFLKWEIEVAQKFDDLFGGPLCISDDELSVIKNPEFVFVGAEYVEKPHTVKATKSKRTRKRATAM
jgi:hypothetical protein